MEAMRTTVDAACSVDGPSGVREAAQRELERDVLAAPPALVQLIGALGPFLTSTDARTRARGTDVLARVLGVLRASPVEAGALEHLVRFFADRLDDVPCINASLRAVRALAERADLPAEQVAALSTSLSARVHVPSLAQPERLAAYEVLRALVGVHAHTIALLGLAPALAMGVAKAIDGEKDPRNLLVTFKLSRSAADELAAALERAGGSEGEGAPTRALEPSLDELFDVLGCYFPVKFTPPPPSRDTARITEAQLRDAWHAAACARTLSGRTVKMLATILADAAVPPKLDAARALGACARSLGRAALAPDAERLGRALASFLDFSQGARIR